METRYIGIDQAPISNHTMSIIQGELEDIKVLLSEIIELLKKKLKE